MNLEYEPAFKMHCNVALQSGARVSLTSLSQTLTYAEWLEGCPFKAVNDSRVAEAVAAAEHYCIEGAEPFLLAPVRRDYLREPGDMSGVSNVVTPIEWLPMVQCVGVFSTSSRRSVGTHSSCLTVVWFQDEYALPIDARILERIAFINWNAVAVDVPID